MRRKSTISFIAVGALGLLYLLLRFQFGFFTPFNYLTAKRDIRNGKVQIIEIGEPFLNYQTRQRLANQQGFSFYEYGCNVTSDVLNGTKYYNEVMIAWLEAKKGPGWWRKFQVTLDRSADSLAMDNRLSMIFDLVAKHKIVRDEIKLVDSLSKGKRHISLIAVSTPNKTRDTSQVYTISVTEDNGSSYATYYLFLVDGKAMKILNPSGKFD